MEGNYKEDHLEIAFSQRLKAGKRTYFFDVKPTRSDDYYITITESTKRKRRDGDGFYYERHKIFLYKEDFGAFMDSLQQAVDYVKQELPDGEYTRRPYEPYDNGSDGNSGYNADDDDDKDDTDTETNYNSNDSDLKW